MAFESKSSGKVWTAIIGLFAVLCFQTFRGGCKPDAVSSRDTVFMMGKPVVNNYQFTNPTLVKESTVVYDSTRPTMTRVDTDAIVIDYLKRRFYADSLVNDTSRMYYEAVVEKNGLKDIKIRSVYRPRIMVVTDTKYKRSLYIGLSPGVATGDRLTIGFNAGYAWKEYQVGTVADPFRKNYYFYASKRLSFK